MIRELVPSGALSLAVGVEATLENPVAELRVGANDPTGD